MPVGTGSINRAARTSKKATNMVKSAEVAEQAAVNSAEVKAEEVKNPAQKSTTKNSAAKAPAEPKRDSEKKAAVKKTAAPKKVTPTKQTAVKTEEKAPELRVYDNETVFIVGNESCQLTQEMPIHLL